MLTKSYKTKVKIVAGAYPINLVKDAESNIWVICKEFDYVKNVGSYLKIVKINHITNQIEKSFIVDIVNCYFDSKCLAISNDLKTIYYQEAGGIYA